MRPGSLGAVTPERLVAIPLFAGLSPEQLEAVAAVAGELDVSAGAVVAAAGDFGHAMFAIEEGSAEVVADGVVVAQLGRGDVFGEIALLRAGRRTASVVAATPMRLLTFFKRDVWQLEREVPSIADALRSAADARLG
jgi:CRP-like cAMP-binding protein